MEVNISERLRQRTGKSQSSTGLPPLAILNWRFLKHTADNPARALLKEDQLQMISLSWAPSYAVRAFVGQVSLQQWLALMGSRWAILTQNSTSPLRYQNCCSCSENTVKVNIIQTSEKKMQTCMFRVRNEANTHPHGTSVCINMLLNQNLTLRSRSENHS